MGCKIEDYALVGDGRTAALISRGGSVDWLCWPRFDAASCFSALLGKPEHGRWLLAPTGDYTSTRCYRDGTLILETTHETADGAVRVIDYMPVGDGSHLVRIVEGLRGSVAMRMELVLRFDYGSAVPWVERNENEDLRAVAGPHKTVLRTHIPIKGIDQKTVSEFAVEEGASFSFALSYGPSHEDDPPPIEPRAVLAVTERTWLEWARRCKGGTPWDDVLLRSLLTLKALIYAPTGGIVAAPTTSLPEWIGGPRNWDYRFCWLRDSTFTLIALMDAGYIEEARAWRDWLQRAVAGNPEQARILYGIGGERMLPEIELDALPGYEASKPVRIGNAAAEQFQLDVYGEVFDALHQATVRGLPTSESGLRVSRALMDHLETAWREPDEGIWEVRGGRRHFVHSKVMAWVAYDRAIRSAEDGGTDAPVAHWKRVRDEIHAQVCEKGFDEELNSFVQYYGSKRLDASCLLIAHMGFLPADDPRVIGTVEAIGKRLMRDGFVLRYDTEDEGGDASEHGIDGMPGSEGAFLPCSFWYVDNLIAQKRSGEAKAMIERLVGILNDVGLVAEEYDPKAKRMLGNFPQAFSHVALANTLLNYGRAVGPANERGEGAAKAEHVAASAPFAPREAAEGATLL